MSQVIETERLILRPIELSDAERINKLCNDESVAANLIQIDYPTLLEDTINFIKTYGKYDLMKNVIFTIFLRQSEEIIGVIGMQIEVKHERAELGYWLGKDYWGKGYSTEAARGVLEFGFTKLNLNRIYAYCMEGNNQSGKILKKIGMSYEGCLKEHVKKNGVFIDMHGYGMIRRDY